MSTIESSASLRIAAPPEQVYAVLADYKVGHPAILPRPPFTELELVEGGVGSGTVINVAMVITGIERRFHMTIDEPEPGRVLRETDAEAGVETRFIVDPIDDGTACNVTIATRARPTPGLMGWLEKLFAPVMTRRILRRELRQLSDYVATTEFKKE